MSEFTRNFLCLKEVYTLLTLIRILKPFTKDNTSNKNSTCFVNATFASHILSTLFSRLQSLLNINIFWYHWLLISEVIGFFTGCWKQVFMKLIRSILLYFHTTYCNCPLLASKIRLLHSSLSCLFGWLQSSWQKMKLLFKKRLSHLCQTKTDNQPVPELFWF